MSATIFAFSRRGDARRALWRVVETGLTALGQSWLDCVRFRYRPPASEWSPDRRDADEELCLMVALGCAVFH